MPEGKPRSETAECQGECSWLFADLDEATLAELRRMSRTVRFAKNEIVFQEGEQAFGLYIICTGKAKLAKRSPQGKTQILKLLGPGELLGEKTFIDQEVYTAYAKTLEPTKLHFIERANFIEFLMKHPVVALRMIEKLSRELKAFQGKLMETAYGGSTERLARLLLVMAKEYGTPEPEGLYVGVELSRAELAELAGISTETAIRTLAHFKERGMVALDGHKVYVRDREALAALAEPFQITLRENLL
jgi:CRP-like cAMP-binding protein